MDVDLIERNIVYELCVEGERDEGRQVGRKEEETRSRRRGIKMTQDFREKGEQGRQCKMDGRWICERKIKDGN